ncbi:BRCT domain-containing protein [Cephalotus follicularis]|uniref:BRCT domain-containing protein n=1 Tax=Cephalotus follicularis TaxID=3775 RepID=A0A1Q3BQH7_CEPFO|nr:BRCT domain-containing protein [Cephalotus follicularis]
MASLRFRPPQFSEDVAWLPAWLQRHQLDSSKETLINSTKDFEENMGDDMEEGRYNSCHLFLSGEDNSPISFAAPSPTHVLHFQLHLSSDDDSQSNKQLMYTPEPKCDSYKVKALTGVGSKTDAYAIPKTMHNVSQSSPIKNTDNGKQYGEKFNGRYLKDTDNNDAVELSIAASEALVIHELVKSVSSTSETFSTSAVLEATLGIKQARLDGLENAYNYFTEEVDEIDFLSDLDDFTMADAFEDVGLSFCGPCDHGLDISHVKATPISGNYSGFKERGLMCHQWKLSDNPGFGLSNSSSASHVDPILHELGVENSDVPPSTQKVEAVSPVDVNISYAENSEKVDKFRSRWFGCWMGKDLDAFTKLQQNNTRSIPKFFVGETSLLSESADVAPDENSFVHKLEPRSKIASQSSVPFKGFCDKDDEGIFVSQTAVRSSNSSFVDPLCSVVPCSIPMEIAYPISQNQSVREVAAGNCFSPASEIQTESLLKTSDLNVEYANGNRQAEPKVTGECSLALIRRQSTSLNKYSRLLAKHDATFERGRLAHNISVPPGCDKELLSLEQNTNCIRSSSKRDFEGFFPLRSLPESTNLRDNEGSHNSAQIRMPVTKETYRQVKNSLAPADGSVLQIQQSKKRRSALMLNRMMRRHVQAPKPLVCNSIQKTNPDHTLVQKTIVELHNSKNLQKVQSECNELPTAQFPARKRVHFSEVEIELQQSKGPHKLQSSLTIGSNIGASKRSRHYNTLSNSRNQSVKRGFTSHIKDVKRLIFQGIEFLLTGFSSKKEKEIEGLIRNYGGIVLFDIPPPNSRGKRNSGSHLQQLPVVLGSKKKSSCLSQLQSTKFLYGCAVNAFILKVKWLTDSVAAGSLVQPENYMILPSQTDMKLSKIGKPVRIDYCKCIFHKVGILLHGKQSFCTKLAKIFKHGGGQLFKTLQWLVKSIDTEKISAGAIVAEDVSGASRHLQHCALERKIPMMPADWIVKSLHLGKLLPFIENKHTSLSTIKVSDFLVSPEWSEEI